MAKTLSVAMMMMAVLVSGCGKKKNDGAGSGSTAASGSGSAAASGSGSAAASGSGSAAASGSGSAAASGSGSAEPAGGSAVDVALPTDCPDNDALAKLVAGAIDEPAGAKYDVQTCAPEKLPEAGYFVIASATAGEKKEWVFLAMTLDGKRLAQAAVPLSGTDFDGINVNSSEEPPDRMQVFIGNSVSGEGDVWHLTRKGTTYEMTKTAAAAE